jgi:hypothetical protein
MSTSRGSYSASLLLLTTWNKPGPFVRLQCHALFLHCSLDGHYESIILVALVASASRASTERANTTGSKCDCSEQWRSVTATWCVFGSTTNTRHKNQNIHPTMYHRPLLSRTCRFIAYLVIVFLSAKSEAFRPSPILIQGRTVPSWCGASRSRPGTTAARTIPSNPKLTPWTVLPASTPVGLIERIPQQQQPNRQRLFVGKLQQPLIRRFGLFGGMMPHHWR